MNIIFLQDDNRVVVDCEKISFVAIGNASIGLIVDGNQSTIKYDNTYQEIVEADYERIMKQLK
jgi:hypothetical protein